MDAARNSILGERKFRLLNQRERDAIGEELQSIKYLRHQQIHETLELLALFDKPDTAKLVREVAVALMGGRSVSIPCAGGGSVSSETGWDGRKKDEENEDFRHVVGFMLQRPSRLRDMCRKRGKGMAFDVLPPL